MHITQNRHRHESAKKTQEDVRQRKLNVISSSIDMNKLIKKDPLRVDRFGRVDINSNHPNYRYWTEDDNDE